MAHTAPAPASFEEAVSRLETLIRDMESGQLPLETSLAAYQQGSELIRFCQARLAQANGDSRDAPELALTLTRERGARSEPYQNLAKLSLKIPFGGQARNGPRMAQANVELSEALAELHAGREQLAQDIDSARLAHELGQQQARAQAEALQLAEQRLGWIQRAVRAGQLSAPEQWRAQSELHEARSQAQRAQLEAGRAHSRYLQAIGALP
jgi:cobalt-zinc-cadmium efflux system outer membrane protein